MQIESVLKHACGEVQRGCDLAWPVANCMHESNLRPDDF
jgi:hypothetical protein